MNCIQCFVRWCARMSIAIAVTILSASGLTALPLDVQAQQSNFPNRPVRIVVPASPGGAIDAIARLLADRLTAQWGQAVVVENQIGRAHV